MRWWCRTKCNCKQVSLVCGRFARSFLDWAFCFFLFLFLSLSSPWCSNQQSISFSLAAVCFFFFFSRLNSSRSQQTLFVFTWFSQFVCSFFILLFARRRWLLFYCFRLASSGTSATVLWLLYIFVGECVCACSEHGCGCWNADHNTLCMCVSISNVCG